MQHGPEAERQITPYGVGPTRGTAVGLFLVLAVLWFANIGVRTLSEPDEGRYAEIPREMLATGDWIVPTLNGIPYAEKPPLQYWATAGLFALLGVEPWVSRLWTTGLGFSTLVVLYALGRKLYGEAAGRAGALVLASGPLFFGLGHINTLDMALAFFLTASLAAFLCGQLVEPTSAARRRWMALSFLALALATLQKGLVALAMPALALVLYSLVRRDLRVFKGLHLFLGLGIVLALNAPWWLLMQARLPGFFEFFFVREHLLRFLTTVHSRSQPWWFLGAWAVGGTLPWLVPFAAGVRRSWAAARLEPDASPEPASRSFSADCLLLCSAAAVFLFYMPSGSKLAPYILPMFPPLALLAGRELARSRGAGLAASLVMSALLAAALLASSRLVPWLVPAGSERDTLADGVRWAVAGGAVLAGAIGAAALLLRRRDRGRAVEVLGSGLVASFALLLCGSNALEPVRGGPSLAPVIARALEPQARFYCVGTYLQTIPFALGRTCIVVAYQGELAVQFDEDQRNHIPSLGAFLQEWHGSPGAVAIVDPGVWELLLAEGARATVLARESYAVVIARPSG